MHSQRVRLFIDVVHEFKFCFKHYNVSILFVARLNCTSSYSTAGVHTGPQASGHMPAQSSVLHVQQPALTLHSAPSSAVHAPAGAVGVLHGATGLNSQVTGPVSALLPPQASAGAFHTEASLVQPLVTQAAAIWPPGHSMPDVSNTYYGDQAILCRKLVMPNVRQLCSLALVIKDVVLSRKCCSCCISCEFIVNYCCVCCTMES